MAAPLAPALAKLPPVLSLPGIVGEPQLTNDAMATIERKRAEWQGARIDTGLRYQVGYWVIWDGLGSCFTEADFP